MGSLESWKCDVIDQVCDTLGEFSGNELSQRTHREDPWRDARGDLLPAAPSKELISKDAILSYYGQHRIVAE